MGVYAHTHTVPIANPIRQQRFPIYIHAWMVPAPRMSFPLPCLVSRGCKPVKSQFFGVNQILQMFLWREHHCNSTLLEPIYILHWACLFLFSENVVLLDPLVNQDFPFANCHLACKSTVKQKCILHPIITSWFIDTMHHIDTQHKPHFTYKQH